MNELAVQFGEDNRLQGILSLPDGEKVNHTAFIVINAGFTPSAGPFRLSTLLTRQVAGSGLLSLRFDLGGLGDSEPINPTIPLRERTNRDIQLAIEFLAQNYNVKKFILCGLCSGAEDSFIYAQHDARVSGLILIDPHSYKTLGFKFRHFFGKPMFNRIKVKLIKTYLNLFGPKSEQFESLPRRLSLIDFQYIDKNTALRILETLRKNQVHIHYIFTGGMIEKFNHPEQLAEMFKSLNIKNNSAISVTHLPFIEHTQIFKADRQSLIADIVKRINTWGSMVSNSN